MKHILITNDDGIYAPGLKILFRHSQELGKTVIIAPEHDNSAASHSLTMNRPLYVKEIDANTEPCHFRYKSRAQSRR
jgi:5'-nucleotidase